MARKVSIELEMNAEGVVIGGKFANGALIEIGKEADKTGKKISGLERIFTVSLGNLAADAIRSLAGGVRDFAASVVDTGRIFERDMARVQALTGATAGEMEVLTAKARELGAETAFSASEAAQGMQFLAMAGFETSEIVAAMPGLLAQAAAGQVDLATASDITSNILSGFNISATETGRVADVLTATFTSSNTTLESLGASLKFVAPIAQSLGIPIEEVAAAVGKMGDAGIQGSLAGTSLRASLLKLSAPSKDAATLMEQLGINVTNADGSFKSLPAVIEEVSRATATMSNTQRTATLSTLVGQEAVSGFAELVKQGSAGLRTYADELAHADGRAQEVADTQMNTLDGALRILDSTLSELKLTLFETFDEEAKAAIQKTIVLVQHVTTFFREYREEILQVGEVVAWLTVGVTAYTLAVKREKQILAAVAIAQKAYIALTKGQAIATAAAVIKQKALNVAMRLNPVGLVISALTVLLGLLWKFRKQLAGVGATFLAFGAQMVESTQVIVKWIQRMVDKIPAWVPGVNAMRGAAAALGTTIDETADSLRRGAQWLTTYSGELTLAANAAQKAREELDKLSKVELSEIELDLGLGDALEDVDEKGEQAKKKLLGVADSIHVIKDELNAFIADNPIDALAGTIELPEFEAGSIAFLEDQLSRLQEKLKLATGDEDRERLRQQIANIKTELEGLSGAAETSSERMLRLAESIKEKTLTMASEVGSFMSAISQRRLAAIDQEKNAELDRIKSRLAALDAEKERVLASAETEEEREQLRAKHEEKRTQLVNKRAKAERAYEEQAAELRQKAARREKAFAILAIALRTAMGVMSALAQFPPRLGQAVFIGIQGAIQAATAAAQPIPQFATGVTGFGGGIALVGERGPELVTLGAGSNVITNENTRALIGALSDAHTPTDTRLLTAIEGLRSDIQSLGEIKTTIRGNDLELSRQRTQAFKRRVGQI